jgi:hypothetical protein
MKHKFLLNKYTALFYKQTSPQPPTHSFLSSNPNITPTFNKHNSTSNIFLNPHSNIPSTFISLNRSNSQHTITTINNYFTSHHNKTIKHINQIKNKQFENEMNSLRQTPQINPKTNSLLKSHIPIYKKHPKPKRSNTSYPKVDLNAYISKPTQPKLKQQQQHITHINKINNIHYTNTNIHSTIYNDNNNYYSYNRQQQRKNDLNSLISFVNSIVS